MDSKGVIHTKESPWDIAQIVWDAGIDNEPDVVQENKSLKKKKVKIKENAARVVKILKNNGIKAREQGGKIWVKDGQADKAKQVIKNDPETDWVPPIYNEP